MIDRADAIGLLEFEAPKLGLEHFKNLWDPTENLDKILAAISRAKDELVAPDRPIADTDLVDLSGKGIERFITVIRETTEGLVALPSADRRYLEDHGLTYEIVGEAGSSGVVIKNFPLPPGKFDRETVDVMIQLPAGYPDASVDMFYTAPWIKLKASGRYANCANVAHQFAGTNWQRWSRHAAWRAGIDGIRTMVARAELAFQKAA